MSLINQMLQDLDRRHATMAGSIPLETVRASNSTESFTPVKKNSPKLAIGLMTLALCAGASWYAVTQMHLPLLKFMHQHPNSIQAEVISSANANVREKAKPVEKAKPLTQSKTFEQAENAQQTIEDTLPKLLVSANQAKEKATDQAADLKQQLAQLTQTENTNAALLQTKIDEINQLKTQVQQMAEEATNRQLMARPAIVSAKRLPAIDNAAKPKVSDVSSATAGTTTEKLALEAKAETAKPAAVKPLFNKQTSPEQEAEANYSQALSMLQLGRPPEAQDLLTKSLALNPGSLEIRQTLVGVLVDLKRNNEAMDCLKAGLQLAPQQIGFSQILARLLVENDQRTEAMAVLTKALPYAQEDAQFHAFLAALLQRDEQHKQAIEHYLVALKHGNQANWLVGLGISLQAEGRMQEAREVYTRAQSTPLNNDLAQFVDQRLKQVQQQIN